MRSRWIDRTLARLVTAKAFHSRAAGDSWRRHRRAVHDRWFTFDTETTALFGGRLFVKGGAEGVHCAALLNWPGRRHQSDDGSGRAADVAMAAVIGRFFSRPMRRTNVCQGW